ncbi:biotin-independent malonate decarboxylase subunit beta [Legionella pneumophila serogroup 2]|nr:biotin-independent malonate decarboxylase subunit beta [Legionella pneumophila]HBD9372420.1 biotin-independent malonate decarboxylase subunit beta [Legionella pneumophila]
MDKYQYTFSLPKKIQISQMIKVGVAGSGNLEVIIKPNSDFDKTDIIVNTVISGFRNTWDAVIERFVEDYPYGGLSITLNDAGATPPVVSLRLRQAMETYQTGYHKKDSYTEANARNRIYSLVDEASFTEFLLDKETPSPTLPQLNMQVETDDGVIVGTAKMDGIDIAIASQQKDFIGGSVGEIHGAKINGLIKYAIKNRLPAIIFLIDSGGVRLQEANVGEIEISEIIRSILDARSAGIKTIGVICGNNGAFGGMGIISGTLDYLIVNQGARIGVSGAEVIQAVKGVEVFDSSNRPLVWRVYGGRTRFLKADVQGYTTNKTMDIRQAIKTALKTLPTAPSLNLNSILAEHEQLQKRIASAKNCREEGEWLKNNRTELYQQDIFNVSDQQFLALTNKGK